MRLAHDSKDLSLRTITIMSGGFAAILIPPLLFVAFWVFSSLVYHHNISHILIALTLLGLLLYMLRFFFWIFQPTRFMEHYYRRKLESQLAIMDDFIKNADKYGEEEKKKASTAFFEVSQSLENQLFINPNRFQLSLSITMFISLILLITIDIFSFAFIFWCAQKADGSHFNNLRSWLDSLYFSTISFASVGYGDIYAVTSYGKMLIILEIFSAIAILGFFFFALTTISTRVIEERIKTYKEQSKRSLDRLREYGVIHNMHEIVDRVDEIKAQYRRDESV